MKDIEKLKAIASSFDIDGAVAEVKALGEGFINDTLTVVAVWRNNMSRCALPSRLWFNNGISSD